MHKRVFSWILVCCVVGSCLIVPAYATEDATMQQLLNVLEFDTVNGSGNYHMTSRSDGTASASFTLPYGTLIRYVDMYVSGGGHLINEAYLNINGTKYPLTIENVYGNTYFRIYGQFNGAYTNKITIEFGWAEQGTWKLQFYSLHVSAQTFSGHSAPSTLTLEGLDQYTATQETGTSAIMLTAKCGSEADGIPIGVGDYLVGVHNDEWQKFDYMNFTMIVYVATVNSITCTIRNQQIPIEINFIEGTIPEYDSMWNGEGNVGENRVFYDVNVRVDLTGVNRTLTDELVLTVAGSSSNASVALYDSRGYTIASLPSAEVSWLQRIWNSLNQGFQNVVDAITGDVGSAEDFQDAVNDKSEELETMVGIMDSVDKPDTFDPDITISSTVNDGLDGFGPGLVYVITSPYIFPLIGMSLTLAFVSYALFGKRG